jgi:hypothetical protein
MSVATLTFRVPVFDLLEVRRGDARRLRELLLREPELDTRSTDVARE